MPGTWQGEAGGFPLLQQGVNVSARGAATVYNNCSDVVTCVLVHHPVYFTMPKKYWGDGNYSIHQLTFRSHSELHRLGYMPPVSSSAASRPIDYCRTRLWRVSPLYPRNYPSQKFSVNSATSISRRMLHGSLLSVYNQLLLCTANPDQSYWWIQIRGDRRRRRQRLPRSSTQSL